jgi:hypothetical protein
VTPAEVRPGDVVRFRPPRYDWPGGGRTITLTVLSVVHFAEDDGGAFLIGRKHPAGLTEPCTVLQSRGIASRRVEAGQEIELLHRADPR